MLLCSMKIFVRLKPPVIFYPLILCPVRFGLQFTWVINQTWRLCVTMRKNLPVILASSFCTTLRPDGSFMPCPPDAIGLPITLSTNWLIRLAETLSYCTLHLKIPPVHPGKLFWQNPKKKKLTHDFPDWLLGTGETGYGSFHSRNLSVRGVDGLQTQSFAICVDEALRLLCQAGQHFRKSAQILQKVCYHGIHHDHTSDSEKVATILVAICNLSVQPSSTVSVSSFKHCRNSATCNKGKHVDHRYTSQSLFL